MKAVFPFCNIQHAQKTLSTTFYAQMDTFFFFFYIILKCYVHNTSVPLFTTFSQYILVDRLLQVINWIHNWNYFFPLITASNNLLHKICCENIIKMLQTYTFLFLFYIIILKCYVHNIFTTLSRYILVDRLLQVINLNPQLELFFPTNNSK